MRIEILPDEVRSVTALGEVHGVTAVGEVHSETPLDEVGNEILPDEVHSGTPLGEVRSGIFPDEVQSVALRGEIRSGTPLCVARSGTPLGELRSEIFPDEVQGVALRGEVRIETLPDEVHIEIPPAQVSMNLWALSRHEVPEVFYRTPFHEVSRAGKDLWTFSRHEEPQVFHRTTPFHVVFVASMNLWTLSPPCEALQVSCKTLVEEEVSRIDKHFLALLGHGKPEGHCMDPPGEVSELGKDLWRLSRHEVPQVSRKTPFVIEVSARDGEGFLALLRHEDEEPAQAHHTTLADEVAQVAAGTEFKMFLHLEVLEARRRSTNATEEHLGAAVAIEEDQDTAIAAEDQGAAAAEEDQGTVVPEEDQGTAVAEEDQGTTAAEVDLGTAAAEGQGIAAEEDQVTVAAADSHTQ